MADKNENINLLCFFLSFLGAIIVTDCHSCSHSVPKRNEVVHHVHLEPAHIVKKRSIDSRLRIQVVYSDGVSDLRPDRRKLVQDDLIPSAVSYWEDTLKVRNTTGPIRLLRQCTTTDVRYKNGDHYPYCVKGCQPTTKCGEVPVPDTHLEACRVAYVDQSQADYQVLGEPGEGVSNADFILYVSVVDSVRCQIGSTVAYAAYCQLEAALDRPIAGYVNLCPDAISTQAHDIHQMHSTIKHEILHALGFSAGLYAFFRDEEGEPLTARYSSTGNPPYNEQLQMYQWSDRVVRSVTRPWKVRTGFTEKSINVIVTKRVVKEVRKHFGCDTLEGAELEDQGPMGTALTHWEKRIFENEVMTGTYTQNPMISRVTLALMEDTGWYRANYDHAEPLTWGKDLGCDFVLKSCLAWMEIRENRSESVHPYCRRVKGGKLQTECTDRRDAMALCNLVEYVESLPKMYQHFTYIPGVSSVDKFAGSVMLADYCPYIQEFNWKRDETIVRGSKCNLFQNNADPEVNYALEAYGNISKCFEHHSPWRVKQCATVHDIDEHWGSGCYQYECSTQRGLVIVVFGQNYQCYHTGQHVKVRTIGYEWLHEGTIVCPSCQDVCGDHPWMTCPLEMNPPNQRSETPRTPLAPPCTGSAPTPASHSCHGHLKIAVLVISVVYFLQNLSGSH